MLYRNPTFSLSRRISYPSYGLALTELVIALTLSALVLASVYRVVMHQTDSNVSLQKKSQQSRSRTLR